MEVNLLKHPKITNLVHLDSQVNFITPGFETEIKASIRTVTGTSANGNESSFVDQGYEPVLLNELNYFNTPRLVCSRINETTRLTSLPQK